MTITHVQSGGTGAAGPAASIGATISAVGSGNLLAGAAFLGSTLVSDFTSITDDKGNTYTIVDKQLGTVSHRVLVTFYCPNITNAPTVITANFANTPIDIGIFVDEYSGIATSTPLDGHAIQAVNGPGTGTDALSSGSITTTASGDLIYGVGADLTGSADLIAGTGFTQRVHNSDTGSFVMTEDLIQSTAGAIAATFSFQIANNDDEITAVMAFSPPPAAPPSPSETYGTQIYRPRQPAWR